MRIYLYIHSPLFVYLNCAQQQLFALRLVYNRFPVRSQSPLANIIIPMVVVLIFAPTHFDCGLCVLCICLLLRRRPLNHLCPTNTYTAWHHPKLNYMHFTNSYSWKRIWTEFSQWWINNRRGEWFGCANSARTSGVDLWVACWDEEHTPIALCKWWGKMHSAFRITARSITGGRNTCENKLLNDIDGTARWWSQSTHRHPPVHWCGQSGISAMFMAVPFKWVFELKWNYGLTILEPRARWGEGIRELHWNNIRWWCSSGKWRFVVCGVRIDLRSTCLRRTC